MTDLCAQDSGLRARQTESSTDVPERNVGLNLKYREATQTGWVKTK